MNKHIPFEKLSKRKKRDVNTRRRCGWGELNPVTRRPPNPRAYNRICTTHDVLLLDEDIRRDQIWFVDKDEHSVSSLYSLSDFKDVRKNSDILKRYLLGVYGAVPIFK